MHHFETSSVQLYDINDILYDKISFEDIAIS